MKSLSSRELGRIERTRSHRLPRARAFAFLGWILALLVVPALVPTRVAIAQPSGSAAPSSAPGEEPTSEPKPKADKPAPTSTSTSTSAPAPADAKSAKPADAKPTSTASTTPAEEDRYRRATPRRTYVNFLRTTKAGEYAKAAEYLDLRGVPRGKDQREASELAAMLARVLEWHVAVDPETLPDETLPEDIPPDGILLEVVDVDGQQRSLVISREKLPTGEWVWLFSKQTVSSIRPIYDANRRRVIEEAMPEWLLAPSWLELERWQWCGLFVFSILAWVVGRTAGALSVAITSRLAKQIAPAWRSLAESLRRPTRLALAAVSFQLAMPYLLLPAAVVRFLERVPVTLYVVAVAWAVVALVRAATSAWEQRLPSDTEGDLATRGTRTRVTMLRRFVTVLTVVVAAGVVLLQFDVVRSVGVSLLASAGIAGVLVGFAAQRSLGGIIAGIELSITQPLRIGDVVQFKAGETGRVEHIYFTYVVVRLWDDRRLIVPVTRVMSEPFENWTRTANQMLAPVDVWVDHAAPIASLRAAFQKIVEQNERWDRRHQSVEVVEMTDKALRVRGIASIDDATKVYAFRCALREAWITEIQNSGGSALFPHGRVESTAAKGAADSPQAQSGLSPADTIGQTPDSKMGRVSTETGTRDEGGAGGTKPRFVGRRGAAKDDEEDG